MYSSEIKLCTQGKNDKKRVIDTKGHMLNIERDLSLSVLKRKTGWSTNYMIRYTIPNSSRVNKKR